MYSDMGHGGSVDKKTTDNNKVKEESSNSNSENPQMPKEPSRT